VTRTPEQQRNINEFYKECEEAYGPFPEKGQRVKFRIKHSGKKGQGTVRTVWMAEDTIAIDIEVEDDPRIMTIVSIMPEFGDTWKPLQ
jgi:hypothetical protein